MTDLQVFRMLVRDKDSDFFEDTEAQWFIDNHQDGIRLAAAAGLETLAADAAKVARIRQIGNFQTSGVSVPKALRDAAKALREAHRLETIGDPGEPFSVVVEEPTFPWRTYTGEPESD